MSNTPFRLIASNSIAQTLTTNVAANLVADTLDMDSLNVGSRSSNSIIIIPFSGLYLVAATVGVAAAAAGPYRLFATVDSEMPALGAVDIVAVASQRVDLSISVPIYLLAGDTLNIQAFQNSGGNIDIGTTTEIRTKISVIKLSD